MKSVVIKGELRKSLGKKDAKKLRVQEKAPAVLYGGDEPIHFSVEFSELRKLVYTPNIYLIDLEINGEVHKAMMQDIQWHPVDEQVLHVDFLKIHDNKPIKIDIPVKVTGFAKGIKAGGKLSNNLRRLKVKALANYLPDEIEVDITPLGIGDSIKIADLDMPNVEFLDAKSSVVVSIIITRIAKSAAELQEEEEAEEGVEGAEGAEGEGGEAPASEE